MGDSRAKGLGVDLMHGPEPILLSFDFRLCQ